MNVTDQEMAYALNRTLSEIEELKKSSEAEYKVLKTGVLCQKLNLSVNDLEKMSEMKVTSQTS